MIDESNVPFEVQKRERKRRDLKQAKAILSLMQSNNLTIAPTDVDQMRSVGVSPSRLPVYIYELRHKLNVQINSICEGRKVVAYRLVELTT